MRCQRCGNRNKNDNNFCPDCGAKIEHIPSKTKAKKSIKGRLKFFTVLILAALIFLFCGGERVPEPIQNIEAYSKVKAKIDEKTVYVYNIYNKAKTVAEPIVEYVADKAKDTFDKKDEKEQDEEETSVESTDKHSEQIEQIEEKEISPEEQYQIDNELPDTETIKSDLSGFKDLNLQIEDIEIQKSIKSKDGKKNSLYVIAQIGKEENTKCNFYKLQYKKHLTGWKLEEAKGYNIPGESESIVGVKNDTVIDDLKALQNTYDGNKIGNVKVLEHYTDVKEGRDVVTVYVTLSNEYIVLGGTKEVLYKYNKETKQWENAGIETEINCTDVQQL